MDTVVKKGGEVMSILKPHLYSKLEILFDRGFVEEFELIRKKSDITPTQKIQIEFVFNILTRCLDSSLKIGQELFLNAKSTEEQAFALQWIVVACEKWYNLDLRNQYLKRWNIITGWGNITWIKHLKYHHNYQSKITRH